MAKATTVNLFVNTSDQLLSEQVTSILGEEHGVRGVLLVGQTAITKTAGQVKVEPDLVLADSQTEGVLTAEYNDISGKNILESTGNNHKGISQILSRFVMHNLYIPLQEQTSRLDYEELSYHSGRRPNIELDPSTWIVSNPFIADLCRRYPEYGNLVRYLCNERGLFLKVGNYPNQRAYWNSTTNGGLPVYKKSDPIHEGTFMLHDMFHFVPTDPIIGVNDLEDHHKATYIAHRLLSEASTLVLADMVAVADASLGDVGYDVSKRKIFPVYESIAKSRGEAPEVDKLLAANAHFCFTGDPEGFRLLGASEDVLADYKAKYEAIFRDDFMWNLHNLEAMISERSANPRMADYYKWLEAQALFPRLVECETVIGPNGHDIDIPKMLSLFRAEYKNALNYQRPIDDQRRIKLGIQKYLAGQRIVFARFGGHINPDAYLSVFDESYSVISEINDPSSLAGLLKTANNTVDNYVQALFDKGYLLPHEAALYSFSVPLYPIKFVNYERKKPKAPTLLSEHIREFVEVNNKQLSRLLEAAAA